MMKKMFISGIVLFTLLLLPVAFAQSTAALNATSDAVQDAQDKTDAGVLPGTLLYGLDIAWERIQLALTTDPAVKAELALANAKEHLAEARVEERAGDVANEDRALSEQSNSLDDVDKAKPFLNETVRQHVDHELEKHVERLNEVRAKLALKGVDTHGIDNAIVKSSDVLSRVHVPNPERNETVNVVPGSQSKAAGEGNAHHHGY